ncbi:hypothetical protein CWB98_24005, partial [Pseudoalteromonas rubra]
MVSCITEVEALHLMGYLFQQHTQQRDLVRCFVGILLTCQAQYVGSFIICICSKIYTAEK